MSALGWIIVLIVIAAALVVLAAWFFERATNEVALVKTGIGGRGSTSSRRTPTSCA